jgi:hypothetical protein
VRSVSALAMNRAVTDVVGTALGRARRGDPVLPRTGGPAGNARLTAWIGLGLLIAFLAELVTLLDVTGLISWHIVIGVLLVPPALAKTATTGWRILRYYTGYRQAGPPPLLLRLLGPLVVLTTLAVLGTGLALIPLGPDATFTPLLTVAGQQISWLTLHQVTFIAWGVATGLHVLARTVPAARLALAAENRSNRVAGTLARSLTMLATVIVAAIAAVIILRLSGSWTGGDLHRFHHRQSADIQR